MQAMCIFVAQMKWVNKTGVDLAYKVSGLCYFLHWAILYVFAVGRTKLKYCIKKMVMKTPKLKKRRFLRGSSLLVVAVYIAEYRGHTL